MSPTEIILIGFSVSTRVLILFIVSTNEPWIKAPKGSLSLTRSSGVIAYATVIFKALKIKYSVG